MNSSCVQKLRTRSEFIIWNLCEMSAELAGKRVRPDTKRRNWILSSFAKVSSTSQNHNTTGLLSSIPRYLKKVNLKIIKLEKKKKSYLKTYNAQELL